VSKWRKMKIAIARRAAHNVALALIAAGVLLAACASASAPPMETAYPFHKMPVPMDFSDRIYWVDDHTVIFAARIQSDALESGDAVPARLRRDGKYIYTWNVDTGAVDIYASLPDGSTGYRFCFDYGSGQVWRAYDVFDTGTDSGSLHMAGQLGHETPLPEALQVARKVRFDHTFCQVFIDTPVRFYRESGILRVHERHGYMELPPEVPTALGIPEQLRHKTMIYHTAQGASVTIPLENLSMKLVSWVPFKGAYFIVGPNINTSVGKAERQRSSCRWAMWLWPDGRYQELCYPWAWWSEFMYPAPSAVGLIARLKPPNRKKGELWSWPYLISESTATPLLTGGLGIQSMAVSPNGCRLLFGFRYISHKKVKGQGTDLRVIDLCKSE
jgi:hypothetical protein